LPLSVTPAGTVAVVGSLFVNAITILSASVAEPFIETVAVTDAPPTTVELLSVIAVGAGGTTVTVAVALFAGLVVWSTDETVTVLVTGVRVTCVETLNVTGFALMARVAGREIALGVADCCEKNRFPIEVPLGTEAFTATVAESG